MRALSSHPKRQRRPMGLFLLLVSVIGLWVIYNYQALSQAQAGVGTTFIDVSSQSNLPPSNLSWAVAWQDFNNDGFFDIYFSNHTNYPSLFRSNGGATFTDVATDFGFIDMDHHGAAWADYDNDGDPDLYQSAGNVKPSVFYRNDGGSSFTNIAAALGVDHAGAARNIGWADYNRDGHLDFFLTNSSRDGYQSELYQSNGDGTFTITTSPAQLGTIHAEGHMWGDYDGDDWPDLLIWSRSRLNLYRNQGDGTFEQRSEILEGVTLANIKDIGWVDYDSDGDLDIYVARGHKLDGVGWDSDSIAWKSAATVERGFDFRLSSPDAEVTFRPYEFCSPTDLPKIHIGSSGDQPDTNTFTLGSGQGSDPLGKPSYTPEVDEGVFIWVDGSGEWHYRFYGENNSGRITANSQITDLTPYNLTENPVAASIKNELWENLGNETFTNATEQAGVGDSRQARGALWADFDNDGDLDLYVANEGHFLDNEPNSYYQNNGDKTFQELTAAAGLDGIVGGYGHGAAAADYNNDGFLDILAANGADGPGPCEGPHQLFQNQGNSNHWLDVRTVGMVSNRDGVGAKLTLEVGGLTQHRHQHGGQHNYVQDSPLVHFGLGAATVVDRLTVTWPSGLSQTLINVNADQILTVVEPTALAGVSFTMEPSAPAEGEPVTFTAHTTPSVTTPPAQFTWNFGDGSEPVSTTESSVLHTYSQAGSFSVQLEANNTLGSPVIVSQQVTIAGQPVAGASFTAAQTGPESDTLTTFSSVITPGNATKPISYTWNFGDNSPEQTTAQRSIDHDFAQPSTYSVWLTATNNYGQAAFNLPVTVPYDNDGDGLNNALEEVLGTDPDNADTDGDKINDALEVGDTAAPTNTDNDEHINPLDADDDGDGIPTIDEDINGDGDPTNDIGPNGLPYYLDPLHPSEVVPLENQYYFPMVFR